jgi:CRP/FNR family cyclic AMP-dependent transcriptional regulator
VIRTREGWIRPLTAFEAVPFVRSGTPPSPSLARGTMRPEQGGSVDAHKLQDLPVFADLSRKQLERVARWADEIDLRPGYHLLDQGSFPHEFFVILDGTVDITKDGVPLATLGRGEILGEIALLDNERRTATVVAATPVQAAVMSRRDFDEMRAVMPAVAARIERIARERLTR